MKVVSYSRVSTSKQDVEQQQNVCKEWLKSNHMRCQVWIKEEGVSGGVSYKSRRLGTDVLPILQAGDVLLVSEISRLGRSMSDISRLFNEELQPRRVRVVAVRSALDLDCSNMTAQTQMILNSLTFGAQIEKEMIQQRTQSAIDVRQQKIRERGGFMAKRSGRYVTKLGAPSESLPKASAAGVASRRRRAQADPTNIAIWKILKKVNTGGGAPTAEQLRRGVVLAAEQDLRTPKGKTINVPRLRNSYYTLSKIFNS